MLGGAGLRGSIEGGSWVMYDNHQRSGAAEGYPICGSSNAVPILVWYWLSGYKGFNIPRGKEVN